ncbi:MAG: hypothetical protein R6W66_02470 [Pelovirga sp.]
MTNENEFDEISAKIIGAAEAGSFQLASTYLSQADQYRDHPLLQSYQAYCEASTTDDRARLRAAAQHCLDVLQRDPTNTVHYLNMGRILLCCGERKKAISFFRKGLKAGPSPLIIKELKQLGFRQTPVISRLERDHPLNRYLGRLLSRLGLR